MAELLARFVSKNERGEQVVEEKKAWPLEAGREVILQREGPEDRPVNDSVAQAPVFSAPWDAGISRRHHASVLWTGERLRLRVYPEKPPAWSKDRAVTELEAAPGEDFWLGRTLFSVRQPPSRPPVEKTCSPEELTRAKFVSEGTRLDALADLPELIRRSPDDARLYENTLKVLFDGIVEADQAAVVSLTAEGSQGEPAVNIHATRRRGAGRAEARVSRKLVLRALRRRQPFVHYYAPGEESEFTLLPGADWAMCVPLAAEGYQDWGLYLAGRLGPRGAAPPGERLDPVWMSNLKFARVVAESVGSLLQARDLERRLSLVGRVLPPRVRAAIRHQDIEEVLARREVDVTVLFCDLRNSCRLIEQGREDLMGLWDRVSEVLEIMTRAIVAHRGVIGDFQGDAAMGFWGWPLPQPDQVDLAARAALQIRHDVIAGNAAGTLRLGQVACGIGLAHGRAVAGRLGTWDQFKVGVFGPVVNRAARLESYTKQVGVPIVADDAIGAVLARHPDPERRTRRLARVKLLGIDEPVLATELLPPEGEPGPNLAEADRLAYESALDAFHAGDWLLALTLLRPDNDPVARMLHAFIAGRGNAPPEDWKGVISLESK